MLYVSKPVTQALTAYIDADARRAGFQQIGSEIPPGSKFPIVQATAAEIAAAHETIRALRRFLEVARDELISLRHFELALGDLIAEYDDPAPRLL